MFHSIKVIGVHFVRNFFERKISKYKYVTLIITLRVTHEKWDLNQWDRATWTSYRSFPFASTAKLLVRVCKSTKRISSTQQNTNGKLLLDSYYRNTHRGKGINQLLCFREEHPIFLLGRRNSPRVFTRKQKAWIFFFLLKRNKMTHSRRKKRTNESLL